MQTYVPRPSGAALPPGAIDDIATAKSDAAAAKAAADALGGRTASLETTSRTTPASFLVGAKALLGTLKLVDDLSGSVGDAFRWSAGAGSQSTFTVVSASTVQDLIDSVNATTTTSKVKAARDSRGRLFLSTTDYSALSIVAGPGLLYGLLGSIETGATPTIEIPTSSDPGDIARKLALGAEVARGTSRQVVVRMPAGAITLTAPLKVYQVQAPNLSLLGQPIVTTAFGGAGCSITNVGGPQAGTGAGVQTYDVTYTGADFSAFMVGDLVGLTMTATGNPNTSFAWPALCGALLVVAKSSTSITVRTPTRLAIGTITQAGALPFSGANSVAAVFHRFPTQIVGATSGTAIDVLDSRLGLGNVAIRLPANGVNASNLGILVGGTASEVTLGTHAVNGINGYPLLIGDGARIQGGRAGASPIGLSSWFSSGCIAGPTFTRGVTFSLLTLDALVSTGQFYDGFGVLGCANFTFAINTIVGGCGGSGVAAFHGSIGYTPFVNYTIQGNGGGAIYASYWSFIRASGLNANLKTGCSPSVDQTTPANFGSNIWTA